MAVPRRGPRCVEWSARKLSARALLGLYHPPWVADAGRAYQAAADDEQAGHHKTEAKGVD